MLSHGMPICLYADMDTNYHAHIYKFVHYMYIHNTDNHTHVHVHAYVMCSCVGVDRSMQVIDRMFGTLNLKLYTGRRFRYAFYPDYVWL